MSGNLYAKDFTKTSQVFCATRDDQAPLFSASAFHNGQIINVNLNDFKGKWVLLFFYPSDFTFV